MDEKGQAIRRRGPPRPTAARPQYPAGIWMEEVHKGTIRKCTGLLAQNGALLYRCDNCLVTENDFSCNSSWGIGLYMTTDSIITWNLTDFVIRPGCGDSASVVATNGCQPQLHRRQFDDARRRRLLPVELDQRRPAMP